MHRRQQPGAPDRVGSEGDQIDGLALEDEAITLSLDPLSEVADHPLHALRLLQDGHDAGLVVALLVLQQLGPGSERPQRRGQVVAGHHHEVPVGPLTTHGLRDIADDREHRHPLAIPDHKVHPRLEDPLAAVRALQPGFVGAGWIGVGEEGVVVRLGLRPLGLGKDDEQSCAR